MTTYYIDGTKDIHHVSFEADGHFFGLEPSVLGTLFLVKDKSVIAAFKNFKYFTIDPATLPVPLEQTTSEAA